MDDVQRSATQLIKRLVRAGYRAYFAGGWVRDYVMQRTSSDIDIATDAPPEKILDLFPNTVHVGVAFGVVIVAMGEHKFEVATFRKDIGIADGRRPLGIQTATAEEDAKRRDFTINGMFYDPIEDVVHDFVNGREDIHHQRIRTIGDPQERFKEDRLRMIRAFRFAARFGFRIDQETQEAIQENAETLFPAVSMERIWQEFNKMRDDGHFDEALMEMHRLHLLQVIFPEITHMPLHRLVNEVAAFVKFPKEAPTIAYLMALFPEKKKEEAGDLCRYLKASNRDIHFAELLVEARLLHEREVQGEHFPELFEWALFYADLKAELALEILAAAYSNEERKAFLYKHQLRQKELAVAISRIRSRRPLVQAEHLLQLGILPGKALGLLLKEAERLAVNRALHDTNQVLELLKQSPHWQTK